MQRKARYLYNIGGLLLFPALLLYCTGIVPSNWLRFAGYCALLLCAVAGDLLRWRPFRSRDTLCILGSDLLFAVSLLLYIPGAADGFLRQLCPAALLAAAPLRIVPERQRRKAQKAAEAEAGSSWEEAPGRLPVGFRRFRLIYLAACLLLAFALAVVQDLQAR